MTSVKAPIKRDHFRFWAGEVTMVIDGGNGELTPLTLKTNAMTIVKDKELITPNDIAKAQQTLQVSIYKTMGEEFAKVKDVLSVTILFTAYMGYLSQEQLAITVQQQAVETKEGHPPAANDPYSK
ncbi:hypothetical protein PP747_gp065 [Rhizobium phage RHph_Y38]|uniref:Uncharacterized protein n=1 Tax=Rhizobium phage RHph_Y38 TaxID=2509781 RepID=A0A7S5QX88_9CAUD|nr:hypothetical protein PP747_gp065 [Rhizobium phage RHph_Y38]QIG67766.1 hypothetical protein EVB52_065 [Rhizobium phage RHph_Y38]QXV74830.1 hypothetical protein [Rhizobium phage RHEph24]